MLCTLLACVLSHFHQLIWIKYSKAVLTAYLVQTFCIKPVNRLWVSLVWCLANIVQLHFEIECNLEFNFLTLLFSTNRQKRRFLLPYECCMFCSLYFGKWQSKRYTYTQNTCPLETEEQKDLPLYYHWIQNIVQSFWCSIPNQEKHVTYTLSYRLLINYHSVENESRSQL